MMDLSPGGHLMLVHFPLALIGTAIVCLTLAGGNGVREVSRC